MPDIFGTSRAIVVGAGTVFRPVQRVAPPTPIEIDNFNRSVTASSIYTVGAPVAGMGVASDFLTWTCGGFTFAGASFTSSVDGANLSVASTASGFFIGYLDSVSGPWGGQSAFNIHMRLSYSALSPSFTVGSSSFTNGAGDNYLQVSASNSSALQLVVTDALSNLASGAPITFVVGTMYEVRWLYQPGIVSQAKIWVSGGTEPSGYQVILGTPATPTNARYWVFSANGTSTTSTLLMDYMLSEPAPTCALETFAGASTSTSGTVSGQTHSTGTMSALCGTFGGSYGLQVTPSLALPVSISVLVASDTFPSGTDFSGGKVTVTSSNGQNFAVLCRLGSTGLSSLSATGGTWTGPLSIPDWTPGVGVQLLVQVNSDGSASATCGGQTITRSGTGLSDVQTITFTVSTNFSASYSATVSMSSVTVCS